MEKIDIICPFVDIASVPSGLDSANGMPGSGPVPASATWNPCTRHAQLY